MKFATLAALMIGIGTVGNLISSYPMAFAAETIGWRNAMWGLSAISGAVALGLLVVVQDPAPTDTTDKGSLLDLLRLPVLWLIFPLMFVNYAPVAAVRGRWIGPYLRDVFDMGVTQIGQGTLAMSVAPSPMARSTGTSAPGNGWCLAAIRSPSCFSSR